MREQNWHPSAEAFNRFVTGEGEQRWEAREIVRHLLRGCPECRKRMQEAIRPRFDPADYEKALDRAIAAIDQETRRAVRIRLKTG